MYGTRIAKVTRLIFPESALTSAVALCTYDNTARMIAWSWGPSKTGSVEQQPPGKGQADGVRRGANGVHRRGAKGGGLGGTSIRVGA